MCKKSVITTALHQPLHVLMMSVAVILTRHSDNFEKIVPQRKKYAKECGYGFKSGCFICIVVLYFRWFT